MKNLLTTLFLTPTLGAFAQYGQLPNGSFENWTDQSVYDYPTNWSNSNIEEYQGIATVFQSSDAQDGTYSCELRVEAAGPQDTLFGYVYQGYLGGMGPAGGIPYNVNFDEMQFQYKCDLLPGDTLFVLATRFIAGTPVGTQILPVAFGTQSSWTAGSISFSNGAQDQLFLGLVIGNPMGGSTPSPGSWVRIDHITMHNAGIAVTNLPDASFENWTAVTTENPDDWYSINHLLSAISAENLVKTTDAHTGTYAAELTTTQPFPGGDTVAAVLATGPIDFYAWNPFTAIPYEATPTALTGAYKYAPVSGDQAFIQAIFYQNGNIIGYAAETINATPSYQTFSLPISILGVPDSMALLAYSGDNLGSLLHVDDLAFAGGNVSLDEFSTLNIAIYPNPATTSLMIQGNGIFRYSIVNLSGQEVLSQDEVNGAVELDISALSSGAYFVTITNDFKSESHKLIIE